MTRTTNARIAGFTFLSSLGRLRERTSSPRFESQSGLAHMPRWLL